MYINSTSYFVFSSFLVKQSYLEYGEINFNNEKLILILIYSLLLIIFLFFNLKGSIFLGDAGAYLGSFIIIYLILDIYSNNSLVLKCEQIFFILILPGIDMLRVFILRLIKKKNPFKADSEHLHDLIGRKIKSHKKITFIISLSLFIPNLIILLFPAQMLFFFVVYISSYILSVYYLYKF